MRWTKADIKKTGLANNLHETRPIKTDLGKFLHNNGKISIEKTTIEKLLWVMKRENKIPSYTRELVFSNLRNFRFDWAIHEWKLAIEYEGLMSAKSGHTTINGYTSDCEKYNLAQLEGWIVLRYTAKNYDNFGNDLRKFIKFRTL